MNLLPDFSTKKKKKKLEFKLGLTDAYLWRSVFPHQKENEENLAENMYVHINLKRS